MKHPVKQYLSAALLAAACAGFCSTVMASTFIKMDVPQLKQKSEMVVKARVDSIESAWNPEQTMIYSYVTLEVERTFKGQPQQQLQVRVPGGTVNGLTIQAIGTAQFEIDSDVIVFINRWNDGALKVTGYHQGLSRVVLDSLGNETLRGGAAHGRAVSQVARQLNTVGDEP